MTDRYIAANVSQIRVRKNRKVSAKASLPLRNFLIMRNKNVKIIFTVLGIIFLLNAAAVGVMANFTIGVIAEIAVGAVFFALGRFRMKRAVAVFLLCGLLATALSCVLLCGYGNYDTASYDEDVLIVLGAGVRGDVPTAPLIKRLDRAVEYLDKNKKACVIVTGGQGAQESVTEAYAMEKYLLEKGIAAERIIKEEKASSTFENFKYSKEILDERFPNASVVSVTNDFHIYRAVRIAKLAGVETASIHTATPLSGGMSAYLREILAVLKMWVVDYPRR